MISYQFFSNTTLPNDFFKRKKTPHDLEKVEDEHKHEERGTVRGGPERC